MRVCKGFKGQNGQAEEGENGSKESRAKEIRFEKSYYEKDGPQKAYYKKINVQKDRKEIDFLLSIFSPPGLYINLLR